MAAVVGSNVGSYRGYGSLVSSGVSLNRCTSLLPRNFAPNLKRHSNKRNSSRGLLRVAASMHLDSVSELYDLASNSLYFLSEEITDGPIELPPELLDPLAIPEASPLQVAASVVLTGLITVLLFRAIRRRSKRAKEMKFRSTGEAKTDLKEDARKAAMSLLNKTPEVEGPPPNALQTLFGAAVAGAIALVLYKFTVTVDAGFSGKAVSMNYSIRNLTVTVRTIITGMCYLATFVFAANSIGLTLLSLQLALNTGGPSDDSSKPKSSDSNSELERTNSIEDDSS